MIRTPCGKTFGKPRETKGNPRKEHERKKKLAEREAAERANAIGKSVLGKLDQQRLTALLGRMKTLGVDEVEKRLSA